MPRHVPGEVLVQFHDGASEYEIEDAHRLVGATPIREIETAAMRATKRGVESRLQLAALPTGASVRAAVRMLESHPAVRFAEPNWIYTHNATSNDPYYTNGSLWGMYGESSSPANAYGSQAGEAWANGATGSNSVIVAVIDEGMDITHPDLVDNVWTNPFDPVDGVDNDGNGYVDDSNGWDFYSNNSSVYDGTGDDHGTHVAGTIGAKGGNGQGVAGVCWNVTMISAKFLGPRGGSTADAIEAVDYITDLKTRHGLNIVASNNSWGGGGYSQGLYDAIERANQAGILFMAAAGNSGVDNDSTPHYPSSYTNTNIIAVASITSTGAMSSFSNYGATSVDIGAPGSSIYSTLPAGDYGSYSGTSMATPHVTGAAALYAAGNSGASASQIKSAILNSAVATSSLSGKCTTGGRLNVDSFAGGGGGGGGNVAPSVSITSPADGASFTAPAEIAISASASDSDGSVAKVDFYANGALIGSDSSSPYSITWSGVAAGSYTLTAVATDNAGATTTSSGVSITVSDGTSTGINLTASGYKVKGLQKADLSWSGTTASVDVYRDGVVIATGVSGSSYTDNINKKGGGSYTYRVCESSGGGCSNEATVTF